MEYIGKYKWDYSLIDDFDAVIKSSTELRFMKGASILITGSTGLVGSLLGRFLIYDNQHCGANITIYLVIRNRQKAQDIYGELLNDEHVRIVEADITEDLEHDFVSSMNIDYIVHAASVTASKFMVEKPVETIETSLHGTSNVLKLALKSHCKSFLYLSSMEMYGSFDNQVRVTETKFGNIDPLAVRSNYPESKRMCENMCIAYWKEYGLNVKIARLAQTFGAGILKGENRVFAQFARSAIAGQDIVLHTRGLSEGNYCYSRDVLNALIVLLVSGNAGEAYNVSNEDMHTTIADMAKMVCEKFTDNKSKVVFDIPENNDFGYAADTKMILDSSKLRTLGWKPCIGLEDAYRRMIDYMRNN